MPSQKPVAPPHPHVTVDDVWHGALPKDTQLVAGSGGSRREVVWCTALRARPPAFTPLRGGELLLIDPQVLAAVDSRLTLARLLESPAGCRRPPPPPSPGSARRWTTGCAKCRSAPSTRRLRSGRWEAERPA